MRSGCKLNARLCGARSNLGLSDRSTAGIVAGAIEPAPS